MFPSLKLQDKVHSAKSSFDPFSIPLEITIFRSFHFILLLANRNKCSHVYTLVRVCVPSSFPHKWKHTARRLLYLQGFVDRNPSVETRIPPGLQGKTRMLRNNCNTIVHRCRRGIQTKCPQTHIMDTFLGRVNQLGKASEK